MSALQYSPRHPGTVPATMRAGPFAAAQAHREPARIVGQREAGRRRHVALQEAQQITSGPGGEVRPRPEHLDRTRGSIDSSATVAPLGARNEPRYASAASATPSRRRTASTPCCAAGRSLRSIADRASAPVS